MKKAPPGGRVRRFPLRSIRTPSGRFVSKLTRLPLVKLPYLSEYSTRNVPVIRFPGPSTALAFPLAHEVFRRAPAPAIRKDCGSSSHRLRLFYRDPFRYRHLRPVPQQAAVPYSGGSSHGVLRPSNDTKSTTRHSVRVPPRTPSLPGLSQTPEGFPRRPLQPCFMLLPLIGFSLFEAFPLQPTLPRSSHGDSLSTFLQPLLPSNRSRRASAIGRAPRALCRLAVRDRLGSIASLVSSMPP